MCPAPPLLNLFSSSVNWAQRHPYSTYCLPSPVDIRGGSSLGSMCRGTSPGTEKGRAPHVQGIPVIKVQGPSQVYQQGILKLPKKLAPWDAPILPDLSRLPQSSWITKWLEAAPSPPGPAQAARGEGSERRAAPITLLNSPLAGAPSSELARRRNKSPLKWSTLDLAPGSCWVTWSVQFSGRWVHPSEHPVLSLSCIAKHPHCSLWLPSLPELAVSTGSGWPFSPQAYSATLAIALGSHLVGGRCPELSGARLGYRLRRWAVPAESGRPIPAA